MHSTVHLVCLLLGIFLWKFQEKKFLRWKKSPYSAVGKDLSPFTMPLPSDIAQEHADVVEHEVWHVCSDAQKFPSHPTSKRPWSSSFYQIWCTRVAHVLELDSWQFKFVFLLLAFWLHSGCHTSSIPLYNTSYNIAFCSVLMLCDHDCTDQCAIETVSSQLSLVFCSSVTKILVFCSTLPVLNLSARTLLSPKSYFFNTFFSLARFSTSKPRAISFQDAYFSILSVVLRTSYFREFRALTFLNNVLAQWVFSNYFAKW